MRPTDLVVMPCSRRQFRGRTDRACTGGGGLADCGASAGLCILRFGAEVLAVKLGTPACQNGGMSDDDSVPADTIANLRIDLLGSDLPISGASSRCRSR